MKFYNDFSDKRMKDACVYCHGDCDTVDHIPSKVFLDKPYPDNLFVVPACRDCNISFSKDEEYVAVFIEWLKSMQNGTDEFGRSQIEKALNHSPKLEDRLFSSIVLDENDYPLFQPEHERIKNVIRKHAIGLMYYEMGERCIEDIKNISYSPIYLMEKQMVLDFNVPPVSLLFPEIGSRLMQREIEGAGGWHSIQEENFRYCIGVGAAIVIRMVFQEFLFCEVFI